MSKNSHIPKDNTNATILLVEDEALIALNEAAMLEKNGFTVITAYTGEEAVTSVKSEKIDLVLMDIDLGKNRMDGIKTAEIILLEHDLPIVFCTNHNEKEIVERVKGITRYGYVLKNSGEFVIIEAINMAFELYSLYHASKEKIDFRESEEKYRRAAEEAELEIEDRKKAERQLKETIDEKEFLMKEMNHRIKNNLAIIVSLIRTKASLSKNKQDLSDIVHQIDAIRLVHEKLYQSKDVRRIELKSYIQDLLETVFATFYKHPVTLVNNLDSITLKTRDAITLGLIINEIATNAIKHGFTSDGDPRFTVDLRKDSKPDGYILSLSNTGNPFPQDVDFNNPSTLGLRLIHTLVEQLEGEVELTKEPHPLYTIRLHGAQ